MSQTIDVTGLPAIVVNDLQQLVLTLRSRLSPSTSSETARAETAEEWVARLATWANSHPKRDVVIDDDRESIYAGRGE